MPTTDVRGHHPDGHRAGPVDRHLHGLCQRPVGVGDLGGHLGRIHHRPLPGHQRERDPAVAGLLRASRGGPGCGPA
nr:MAG TPA: hypothetical protein [Caudoviricetes sp.]